MFSHRLQMKYIFVIDAELKSTHILMILYFHYVTISNVELSQHYASIKRYSPNVKHIILLQTERKVLFCDTFCQENIYYFVRHITVKYLSNPFSVPSSIPFSSLVHLLVIHILKILNDISEFVQK